MGLGSESSAHRAALETLCEVHPPSAEGDRRFHIIELIMRVGEHRLRHAQKLVVVGRPCLRVLGTLQIAEGSTHA